MIRQWFRQAASLPMTPLPLFVIFTACLVLAACQIFPSRQHLAALVFLGLSGSLIVLIPLFLGWWKGKGKCVIHAAIGGYTWLLCLWMLASLELYKERGRALSLAEIRQVALDKTSRDFAMDVFFSTEVLFFTILFVVVLTVLSYAMRKLNGKRSLLLVLLSLFCIQRISISAFQAGINGFSPDYIQSVICPWPGLAVYLEPAEKVRTNKQHAAEYLDVSNNRFWEKRPTKFISELHNHYPGRSFIAIVMESQRLSDCEPRDAGAHGGRHGLTPRLKELSKSGITFTNVIQSGTHTNTMAWSVVTGLPNPPGFQGTTSSPLLGELSRSLDFKNSGYNLQWIQAVDTGYSNLGATLDHAGFQKEVTPEELAGFDKTNWTTWGFPDDQIFAVTSKRIETAFQKNEPFLIIVNTISNHSPFKFPKSLPDGTALPENHVGGTLYADWCLGKFIDHINSLPLQKRPIVLITADHSHLENLLNHPVSAEECLERMRLPGLLLLPDNHGAGLEIDAPFSHEDVLDLALHLTSSTVRKKFTGFTRIATATIVNDKYATVSADTLFLGATQHAYSIHGQWGLKKISDQAEINRAGNLYRWVSDFSDRVWQKDPE